MAEQPATGEGRALGAALSAPAPFTSRTSEMALHASDRHVERWAPERDAVKRSRPLGTLSFVDHLLEPWMTSAMHRPSLLTGQGAPTLRQPSVSWVFPRPWYQDELDWMASAREAEEQARAGMLTTRGTYAPPVSAARTPLAGGAPSLSMLHVPDPSVGGDAGSASVSSLAYVAPSMGTPSMGAPASVASSMSASGPQATPVQRALRAWSPQVTFAAAQAAELIAGTLGLADDAGLTTSQRSPVLGGLAYVAPRDVTGPAADRQDAPSSVPLARTVAQLASVQAAAASQSRIAGPDAVRDAVGEIAPIASRAEAVAPAESGPTTSTESAPASSPVEIAFRAEQARVVEAMRASAAPEAAAAGQGSIPELVSLASSSPRAAQALRTVELLARSALSGELSPVTGPRVAMPAGLGGALAGIEASSATDHALLTPVGSSRSFAPISTPSTIDGGVVSDAPASRRDYTSAFAPVWATAGSATPAIASVGAERPAAMDHLAWTDRWLARMSGASPSSLAALDVATERSLAVPRALAVGAPEVVFVIPELAGPAPSAERFASPQGAATATTAAATAAAQMPPATLAAAEQLTPRPIAEAYRIDDDQATPDEVFAAIARAARPRAPGRPAPMEAPTTPAPVETRAAASIAPAQPADPVAKPTVADQVARSSPSAPGAGLHAGLASSPMAGALAHILPLPAAATFDPRAMFSGGLAAAYLGGALSRVAAPTAWSPMLAAFGGEAPAGDEGGLAPTPTLGIASRAPDATWIRPVGGADQAPQREGAALPTTLAPGAGLAAAAAGVPVAAESVAAARAQDAAASGSAGAAPSVSVGAAPSVSAGTAPSVGAPFEPIAPASWSVRAPLLAPVELAARDPRAASELLGLAPELVAASPAGGRYVAEGSPLQMIEPSAWTARPGMTAELAHGFAAQTERTAADLAFDFVSPELLLAARVYGFGAIEAAQAGRLALAGPSGLAAMASALDLTFLRNLHAAAEQGGAGAPATARTGPSMPTVAPTASVTAPTSADLEEPIAQSVNDAAIAAAPSAAPATAVAPVTAYPEAQPAYPTAQPASSAALFGVERRLPRGAFLWPAGVVAALDLRAEVPEGNATNTVAALELLAAGAVADMSSLVSPTWAEEAMSEDPGVGRAPGAPARRSRERAVPGMTVAASADAEASASQTGVPLAAGSEPARAEHAAVEQAAAEVAVPAAQRPRFDSVYLALSQSPAGRSLSPSVRAARALAIVAGQDGNGPALERARAAWSVMPMVYAQPDAGSRVAAGDDDDGPSQAARAGAESMAMPLVSPFGDDDFRSGDDHRPGLGRLAARAGEAIGSYVKPSAPEVAQVSSGAAGGRGPAERSMPEPMVHELVRTGRPFSQVGGGEPEIPSWFESAARKMLDQRGLSETISLAELTLVSTAPSSQVAASTRGSSPAPSMAQAPGGAASAEQGDKPDVDKIAADVYDTIVKLLEAARERAGDPWV